MKRSRATVITTNLKLCAGLRQYFKNRSLRLAGKTWTAAAVIAELEKETALIADAAKARAVWADQIAALRAQGAVNHQMRKALHASVLVDLGNGETELAAFGYDGPKVGKRTVQTKLVAVQKLRATRAARHTMGRRQREAIHGVIETPAPTTEASPGGS